MTDQLIDKLLEAQVSIILALVLLTLAATVFLDQRNKRSNRVKIPSANPGEEPRTVGHNELMAEMFVETRTQLKEANILNLQLTDNLKAASTVYIKLDSTIDDLATRIEASDVAGAKNTVDLASTISDSIIQATEVQAKALADLSTYLDAKIVEMNESRKEGHKHMEDAEKKIQDVHTGQETMLTKIGDVATVLTSIAEGVAAVTAANEQVLSMLTSALDGIKRQLTDVLSAVDHLPQRTDPLISATQGQEFDNDQLKKQELP